jgi:hypothetical protein
VNDTSLTLKLSVQRALVGAVTENLAALTAGLAGLEIRIIATFFTAPSENDREYVECAATEVIADFPSPYTIATECHSLEAGRPKRLDFWAFLRAGVIVD